MSDTATYAGRWIIFVCEACGGATGRHKDCDNAHRVSTPVVPVDEAAVERAAAKLEEWARDGGHTLALGEGGPLWAWPELARIALDAAGESA